MLRMIVFLFLALPLAILSCEVAFAADSTQEAKLYKVDKGPRTVVVQELTLHDDARDKDLQIRVTFPKESGKYPLIVYSHGMFGSLKGYVPLATHWVSHGYVVIQPTHGDSLSLLSPEERKKIRSFKDVKGRMNSIGTLQHYRTRPEDVTFSIDSLDTIEKQVDGLAGKIDCERIGMGGHSFGAHTTLAIGGLKFRKLLGRTEAFTDKRPKALLAISPPGPKSRFAEDAYADIKRPLMMITGTNDTSPRTNQGPDWRKKVFEQVPKGDKYLLFIDGAYHSFGGITGKRRFRSTGPNNTEHVTIVQSTSLAFWDAYLKANDAAREFLSTEAVSAATGRTAKLSTKF